MKKQNGITLIALVITIIVMLILAGVAINLTLGENGIFTKATDAKILTRASSAEEEVMLWKGENLIKKYTNEEQISSETMLQNLKTKNLVYEEEIDREEEIIRIQKKDGTIVKEIAYGDIGNTGENSPFYVGNISER